METGSSLKSSTLPSDGHTYNNAKELYDILVGWDDYYSQRYGLEWEDDLPTEVALRSDNPNDPSMGPGSYRGLDKDGKPLMANRKIKYSLTSKLLK